MTGKAYVTGVGMVPFQKPGKSESYDVMASAATRSALADAGLDYDKVQQAYVGYVYGDSTCGQRALYQCRHDRHPGSECEQQLLDRVVCPVPGPPGS